MAKLTASWEGTAIFSPAGRYRYVLRYRLKAPLLKEVEKASRVNFIMLNPSIANGERTDPTVRRCMGYAIHWGFTELVVTNIFALVSTDPAALAKAKDPIGPLNDTYIVQWASDSERVVCAWGNHGEYLARGWDVRKMLYEAGIKTHAFRLTKIGHPVHPLYQRLDAGLHAFEGKQ